MDNSFLKSDDPKILQQVISRMLLDVNTSMPGTIKSFDKKNQTATIIPNIRSVVNKTDGTSSTRQLPELKNVPCLFPYSANSGFSLTFPVKEGDQCLLIFSQRSIDNWQENGKVNDPVEVSYPRAHSLVDAVAIVGAIPEPDAIQDFNEDAIEIRNKDRSSVVTVGNSNITIKCPNGTITTEALSSILKGNVNVETGITGIATPLSTVVFVNGIAVSII